MITDIAIAAIGFSLLTMLVLSVAHLLGTAYLGLPRARVLGLMLMGNLGLMQVLHYLVLRDGFILWHSKVYVSQLFLTAPLFYFFSRAVMRSERKEPVWKWLALLPALIALLVPGRMMFFVSFSLGSVYFALLAYELFALRSQRSRFYAEMLALSALIMIAGMTLVLGVLMPLIGNEQFVAGYAIMMGLSFVPALYLVIRFPDIVSIASEATSMAYASSTLGAINVERKLEQLNTLMLVDKLYMNDRLNLSAVAEQLALNTHQTSELFNHRLGVGFSRYLRQQRVNEAKRQLLESPDAAVLAIGLAVGFTSQSAFYTAFKQIEGMTPGQYRKK